jgi:alkyl hydroperoxide reductase subunit AhpC
MASHDEWMQDIEETYGFPLNYPLIADPDAEIARLYDMIHPSADNMLTVRSAFIIGADKRVKATQTYPVNTGRNFGELLRLIDSLQLTEDFDVATPVNWRPGEDVMIASSLSDAHARLKFPEGWTLMVKPYIRFVQQPLHDV